MGKHNTKIEWTHVPGYVGATWNPIRARLKSDPDKTGWFCTHASEGCRHCYAEQWNGWRGNGVKYRAQDRDKVEIYLDEKTLKKPLGRRAPTAWFVGSMTDIFLEDHPAGWLDRILAVAALCPQHIFIFLTKRSARMRKYLDYTYFTEDGSGALCEAMDDFGATFEQLCWSGPLPNVWLGVSVEDQKNDRRIRDLRNTPAAVRFVSLEPLLGGIDLACPSCGSMSDCHNIACRASHTSLMAGLDWVIVGGESGPNARPMHPAWACLIREHCAEAGVPFFFKQWGRWQPSRQHGPGDCDGRGQMALHRDGRTEYRPSEAFRLGSDPSDGHPGWEGMCPLGKARAGDLLDGERHHNWPEVCR